MNNSTIRSVWAILPGFLFVVILSIATDTVLEKANLMKQPFDLNPDWFIVFVILYRCLYGISGSCLTAMLPPARLMRHVMIGGIIGLVLSTAGAIALWDQPPHWYPISLIVTALPCAWLGGKIFLRKIPAVNYFIPALRLSPLGRIIPTLHG